MADDDYTPRTTSTNTAGDPVEAVAVTGRPNDEPEPNTTFADRAKAGKASGKAVSSGGAENKAVAKKSTSRKRAS